jgi:hypothetical protein
MPDEPSDRHSRSTARLARAGHLAGRGTMDADAGNTARCASTCTRSMPGWRPAAIGWCAMRLTHLKLTSLSMAAADRGRGHDRPPLPAALDRRRAPGILLGAGRQRGWFSATTKKPPARPRCSPRRGGRWGTRCSTSVAPTAPAGSSELGCRIREPAHEPRALPHLHLVALPQFQGPGDRILIAPDLDIDRAQEVAIPADEIDPVIRHGSAPQPRIRTCPERRGWLALCVTRPAACRQALADRLR